jgi:DNA-3-methyladenine glycosylase I
MVKKQPESQRIRCPWAQGEQYIEYHDHEWGVPIHDDRALFEFLILEGAQAGLSWVTILKKRENYRTAFVEGQSKQNQWKALGEVPAKTPESDAMSKDLKRRGFRFVGSTICYAFMQAVGMVNDHLVDCFRHAEIQPQKQPKKNRS